MTPRDVANNLKKDNTLPGALSLAEALYKKIKEMNPSDLPDLIQIANDSHVSDSLRKTLVKREHSKFKEIEYEKNFWQNVVGILRKQVKG